MTTSSRRSFLTHTAVCAATWTGVGLLSSPLARAVEPIRRPGASRLKLSLAAYSFRDFFGDKAQTKRISLFDFIDYCAEHGCDGTELTSYYFPKEVTPGYLIELKRRAFLRGLAISGTAVGNNFTLPPGPERDQQIASVKQWVDHACVMGAPHIRVFAGDAKGRDKAEAKKLAIEGFEECAAYAAAKGIWLGLENHGGIVSAVSDLLDIVRAVRNPWFGVNLDSGNFYSDKDPYAEMAELAPYAVNAQLKVEIRRRGGAAERTDLGRVVRVLREANYQGYVALEYESKDPWGEVPVWLKQMKEAFA